MATKATFDIVTPQGKEAVNGYKINEFVGLHQNEFSGCWHGTHIPTGWALKSQNIGKFKKKRDCIIFLEKLLEKGLTVDVKTVKDFQDMNPDAQRVFEEAMKEPENG